MFTFFECDTVCLLTLLAAAFQDVIVEKPATSKEGNSEVYVVCRKYKGRSAIAPCLDRLLEIGMYWTIDLYVLFFRLNTNSLF